MVSETCRYQANSVYENIIGEMIVVNPAVTPAESMIASEENLIRIRTARLK